MQKKNIHFQDISKERFDRVNDGRDYFHALTQNQKPDEVLGAKFYEYLSECIK